MPLWKKLLITAIVIVVVCTANILLVLPIFGQAAIDYAHPLEMRWEEQKKEQEQPEPQFEEGVVAPLRESAGSTIPEEDVTPQRETAITTEATPAVEEEPREVQELIATEPVAESLQPTVATEQREQPKATEPQRTFVISYENSWQEGLTQLYRFISLPFHPSPSQCIAWGVFLLFLCILSVFIVLWRWDEEFLFPLLVYGVPILQIVILVLGLIVQHLNNEHFQVREAFAKMTDTALAQCAMSHYNDGQMTRVLASFGIFIVTDFLGFIALMLTGVCTDGVRKWVIARRRRVAERVRDDLQECQLHEPTIYLHGDGRVVLARLQCNTDGTDPFPRVRRSILNNTSLDHFSTLLVGDAFKKLRKELTTSCGAALTEIPHTVQQAIVRSTVAEMQKGLSAVVKERMKKGKAVERETAARALLQQVSDDSLTRFKQDLVAGVEEKVQGVARDFKRHVLCRVRELLLVQQTTTYPRAYCVFPSGVRFIHSEGTKTIVVVEEEPRVRTVYFTRKFLETEMARFPDLTHRIAKKGKSPRFTLAFPYVVFILHFVRDDCESMRCFYRYQPLASLDDVLLWPNLPNIWMDKDCKACLGSPPHKTSDISGRTHELTTHFWQSSFNNDLCGLYNHMQEHDSRLAHIFAWEKASKHDPRFVFDVQWVTHEKTLRQILDEYPPGEPVGIVAQFDRIVGDALRAEQKDITAIVRDFCAQIAVEDRYSASVAKALATHCTTLAEAVLKATEAQFPKTIAAHAQQRDAAFTEALGAAVTRVLEQEFERHAHDVSSGQRIDPAKLLQRIKEGR